MSEDDVAARREKMLARLAQRHVSATNAQEKAELKTSALDLLLEKARKEVESNSPSLETEKDLEERLALEGTGYHEKKIRELLVIFRKALHEKDIGKSEKKGFSFSMKQVVKKTKAKKVEEACQVEATPFQIEEYIPDNAIVVRDLSSQTRVIKGTDGADIRIKGIRNCRLEFCVRASAVHIQDVQDCTFVFLPIETSILMHDCVRLILFASAQQIRVHTSSELSLHVAVKGAVILETCQKVDIAPYRVIYKGEKVSGAVGDSWKHPSDFDWLAEGQSPNWRLLEEDKWKDEEVMEDD